MALNDENGTGMVMPVAPMYGGGNSGFGNSWGGDGWWILILFFLLAGNGGWGFGGGFGGGEFGLYPWLNNSQNINDGFRDSMMNDNVTSIRDGVFGLSTQMCTGFANTQNTLLQNQLADLERSFASQTAITSGLTGLSSQLASCCCDNRLATEQLRYTVAQENCADRETFNYGVRDIIANQTAATQKILDKLCDQELQAERRDNANLRSELMYARGQASQIEQTAKILAGQNNEIDALYNRLSNCPVPSTPVYGRTPIFNCNNGCGCGCGNNGFVA